MTSPFVPEQLDLFIAWICEREKIRQAKEAGAPKPWTQDPFLLQWRACNVRRADDLVSRELLQQWYGATDDAGTLVAAVLGRLVNRTESLMEITNGERFRLAHLSTARERLHSRSASGARVWTGAYIVPGVPGKSKVDSVMDLVEAVAADAHSILQPTLRGTWERLLAYDGLAGFLAGQVTADMALLPTGQAWPDRDCWAPLGPGSARGMNRLLGRPKDQRLSQDEFDVLLPQLMDCLRERIPGICADRQLQAMDGQNCCCEFDKARRWTLGEGSPRSRYPGSAPEQGMLF